MDAASSPRASVSDGQGRTSERAEPLAASIVSRTLVLDWTSSVCTAAVTHAGVVLGEHRAEAEPAQRSRLSGVADGLPGVVAGALFVAGLALPDIERLVVVTGPGSFTALRTAVAFAQGLALSRGIPLIGVSVGDALRAGGAGTTPPGLGVSKSEAPVIWFVGRDRLGRMLLDRGEGRGVQAFTTGNLPLPAGPVILIGAAALEAAAHLQDRGIPAHAVDRAEPSILEIAHAADRMQPDSRPVRPMYVEAPTAIANAGKGRPAPVP